MQLIACGQKGALRLNDAPQEKTISKPAEPSLIQSNEKKKKDLT